MKKESFAICRNCKKWRSSRCCERKQTGHDSGVNDWCSGFKKNNGPVRVFAEEHGGRHI